MKKSVLLIICSILSITVISAANNRGGAYNVSNNRGGSYNTHNPPNNRTYTTYTSVNKIPYAVSKNSYSVDNPESISFSIGTFPVISVSDSDRNYSYDNDSWLPSFSLGYNYQFQRWFSFGAIISYTNYKNIDSAISATRTEHHLSIMPIASFHWFTSPTDVFSLYSSVGAGISNVFYSNSGRIVSGDNNRCAFCGQINFLGFRAGNRFFGFGELGYGTLGIMRFGLGYKF